MSMDLWHKSGSRVLNGNNGFGVSSFLVLSYVGRPSEPVLTDVAGVQQLTSMCPHVIHQRARLREPLTTVLALERLLAGVDPHVDLEPRRRSEPLLADRARVLLLARVHDADVPLHVAESRELRSAFLADERTLARVPAHVVLQRAHATKPLLANIARVRRDGVVGPHVHVKAARVPERLLADRTRKRSFLRMKTDVVLQRATVPDPLCAYETYAAAFSGTDGVFGVLVA